MLWLEGPDSTKAAQVSAAQRAALHQWSAPQPAPAPADDPPPQPVPSAGTPPQAEPPPPQPEEQPQPRSRRVQDAGATPGQPAPKGILRSRKQSVTFGSPTIEEFTVDSDHSSSGSPAAPARDFEDADEMRAEEEQAAALAAARGAAVRGITNAQGHVAGHSAMYSAVPAAVPPQRGAGQRPTVDETVSRARAIVDAQRSAGAAPMAGGSGWAQAAQRMAPGWGDGAQAQAQLAQMQRAQMLAQQQQQQQQPQPQ